MAGAPASRYSECSIKRERDVPTKRLQGWMISLGPWQGSHSPHGSPLNLWQGKLGSITICSWKELRMNP